MESSSLTQASMVPFCTAWNISPWGTSSSAV